MEGKNYWNGLGNLTADPTLRFTQSGEPVMSFRLACSEHFLDKKANERKERTEFVNCVLWGKRGEALSKLLHKGSRIDVTGRLQTRSWEKDGEKRYSTEINVQNVILLDGKRDGGGGSGPSGSGNENTFDGDSSFGDTSDIPF